jgi:hypothetical protein
VHRPCRAACVLLAGRRWDDAAKTFCDRRLRLAPGSGGAVLSDTRTVGAYWTLLADVVTPVRPQRRARPCRVAAFPHCRHPLQILQDRLAPFVAALDDPKLFNRPVRVPTLAANHRDYHANGGYWVSIASAFRGRAGAAVCLGPAGT